MSGEDKAQAGLSYGKYLRLDRLLSAQKLESARHGRLAHDEMLFIITHQAYELWFKQILFELDAVQATFARDRVDDRDIGQVTRGLDRVTEILKLVVLQLDVLETMTPLDFLEFRDLLYPASGFQSAQFREIEVRLGLRPEDRLRFDDQPFENRLGRARPGPYPRGGGAAVPGRSGRGMAGPHPVCGDGRLHLQGSLSHGGGRDAARRCRTNPRQRDLGGRAAPQRDRFA